jgi:hypothetical protein
VDCINNWLGLYDLIERDDTYRYVAVFCMDVNRYFSQQHSMCTNLLVHDPNASLEILPCNPKDFFDFSVLEDDGASYKPLN